MKDLDFAHIAKKLKNTRIAKNLTQEYVANIADVNVSHISNIENNRVQMCNALDTTVDFILSDEYNDSISPIENEILHELHSCSPDTKTTILKIVKALQ